MTAGTVSPPRPFLGDARDPARVRRHPLRAAALGLIRAYQLARAGRPSPCRYLPTCSDYASEAIDRHGLLRGGRLALGRLGRCHPWGGSGHDQLPEREGSP